MGVPDPAAGHNPPGDPAARSLLSRAAFLVGGAGLLTATATDSLAVLGRHTGMAFLGSIEIVQSAVVLAASGAIVAATLARGHAAVHILTERLSPGSARRLASLAALLSALVFVAMTVGSGWLMIEGWAGHERTELLGIPFRWFRLIWSGATLLVAGLFAIQAFARPGGAPDR